MNDHLSEAETRCSPGPTSGPHRPSVPDHELIRCIGRGSYGEVWLAKNVLGTFRAVKVIFRRRFHDARPFEREFLGIQKYEPVSRTHESLVHILHVGCDEPDGYFPPDGPGTPQADIYSLGKVLYEIATGRDRSKFPELPTDLEDPSSDKRFFEFNAVILKACHQNAAARYQSVQALLVDLMRVETGQSVKIAQPSGWLAKIGGLFQLGRQEPPAPQAVPETVAVLSAGDVLKVAYTEQPPSPSEAAEKPQLQFEVWARLKGESRFRMLRDGDSLRSEIDDYLLIPHALSAGYLYLFQIDSTGQKEWLFPQNDASRFSTGSNPVAPGEIVQVPASEAATLFLDRTTGVEHIYAVFSVSRWFELEKALSASSPGRDAGGAHAVGSIQAPIGLRMRGVGGVRPQSTSANAVKPESQHPSQVHALPFSDPVLEATGPFLVVERWFMHVE